ARAPALDEIRNLRLVALDFLRGRPIRPAIFAADRGGSRPALAGLAHAHRVAHRAAVAEHVIKAPFVTLDDDGADRAFLEGHDLARGRRLRGQTGPNQDGNGKNARQRARASAHDQPPILPTGTLPRRPQTRSRERVPPRARANIHTASI